MLQFFLEHGFSERHTCRFLEFNRSTFQYQPRPDRNAELREYLRAFAEKRPRWGNLKALDHLRRKGLKAGHNRVHRLWKQEKLQVKRRSRKKGKPPNVSGILPLVALYPGHVWSVDFIFDALQNGNKLKMLTVGDDFTRECFAIEIAISFPAEKVIATLSRIFSEQGAPKYIRSDNGPEFIAHTLKAWLAGQNSQTFYITPGSPWENGFRESFHGRFRDEFLSGTLFLNITESRVLVEAWRQEYNKERPHQSLNYLTPQEFKQKWLKDQSQATED